MSPINKEEIDNLFLSSPNHVVDAITTRDAYQRYIEIYRGDHDCYSRYCGHC